MSRKIIGVVPVQFSQEFTDRWLNSKDARAVTVRNYIVKGIFHCRNAGFPSDEEYLTSEKVLLEAIKKFKFKYSDAESFTE